MTVEEAVQTFGTKTFTTSAGQNLAFLVRMIYGSDDGVFYNVLQVLNPRFNWMSTPVGVQLRYLDKSVITQYLY